MAFATALENAQETKQLTKLDIYHTKLDIAIAIKL